jgi:hypothetical protein
MLSHAYKEWAVICAALESGLQSLLLRKGGIHEGPGGFRVEQERFWLFPTYVHQQTSGIVPAARPLLERVQQEQPPAGVVRLRLFAEVLEVFQVRELNRALALAGQHVWSEETVRMRFGYRQPGLFVLAVRVHALPTSIEMANTASYEGCKSWVELEQPLPTDGGRPVIADAGFDQRMRALRSRFV